MLSYGFQELVSPGQDLPHTHLDGEQTAISLAAHKLTQHSLQRLWSPGYGAISTHALFHPQPDLFSRHVKGFQETRHTHVLTFKAEIHYIAVTKTSGLIMSMKFIVKHPPPSLIILLLSQVVAAAVSILCPVSGVNIIIITGCKQTGAGCLFVNMKTWRKLVF